MRPRPSSSPRKAEEGMVANELKVVAEGASWWEALRMLIAKCISMVRKSWDTPTWKHAMVLLQSTKV